MRCGDGLGWGRAARQRRLMRFARGLKSLYTEDSASLKGKSRVVHLQPFWKP